MILRILIVALLFTACTSDAANEQAATAESTTTNTNQSEKQNSNQAAPKASEVIQAPQRDNKPGVIETKNQVLESPEEVAAQIMKNFSDVIKFNSDQKQALIELVNQYPIDNLENPGQQRTELRSKIMNEILDAGQVSIWKQYQRKRKLEPVTIE